QKPWAKELCEELGLSERLIPTSSRRVWVWYGGRLHEMPEGVFLTVPTRIGPFLKSSLLSWRGKLRMGLDLVLPRGPDVEDESIGSFIRRRLGAEALEKLAEPIMAGIYVASADELSLRSTFPRMAQLEREHRSLIRGLRKAPPAGNVSPFLSLRGGMGELVERLLARMPGVAVLTGRSAVEITPSWTVRLDDGRLETDHVVLAVPSHEAARLWPGVPTVRYVTTHVVSLAYAKFRELEGTGFVIPRTQNRRILACTWSSNKFAGRAPDDRLLVRCFLKGDVADPGRVAAEEMRELLGAPAEPQMSRVFSWPERNPVYEVGHARRIAEAEAMLPPGLHLCGSAWHGTGLPDCIRDGREVARKVLGPKS
ncbi:MAG TPA: protoporphyrinogen oxidase, partial [Planctomycetota bacterium]|nr:protoporphyrinogen oxidase [Planctomycetota bacterium]